MNQDRKQFTVYLLVKVKRYDKSRTRKDGDKTGQTITGKGRKMTGYGRGQKNTKKTVKDREKK